MGIELGIPVLDDIIDVGEAVVEAVGDVVDDVSSFLGLPPLASEAAAMVTSLVNGPLRDFARTAVGKTVLRALVLGPYMHLAPILGPQFAAVTFAIPGVLRGEKADEAWVKEFVWRVTTTASILSAGGYTPGGSAGPKQPIQEIDGVKLLGGGDIDALLTHTLDAAKRLQQYIPDLSSVDVLSFDYRFWAAALDVRQDELLSALALLTGDRTATYTYCTDALSGNIITC